MFHVFKDDEFLTTAATFKEAQHAVEDDAVIAWDRCRDPNASPREWAYPGLEWDKDECFLEIGRGGVKYQIINPMPFVTCARVMFDGYQCLLVEYDNRAGDYPFNQELAIWL